MIKVFFDASVLFSGFYSSSGASRELLELTRKKTIIGITTQTVIGELEDNIAKFPLTKKINIRKLISYYCLFIREKITPTEVKPYEKIVDPKDTHIITGAILAKCDYLVTLDKKHLDNPQIKSKFSRIKIISPKELLVTLLKLN